MRTDSLKTLMVRRLLVAGIGSPGDPKIYELRVPDCGWFVQKRNNGLGTWYGKQCAVRGWKWCLGSARESVTGGFLIPQCLPAWWGCKRRHGKLKTKDNSLETDLASKLWQLMCGFVSDQRGGG